MKEVHVAVGVILKDGNVFVCLRPQQVHQGGKWEFPGGKVDAGETVEEALTRELAEEIGITVEASQPFMVIQHDYGDKRVRLDIHTVTGFVGEPYGREGQRSRWCPVKELLESDFPEANRAIIQHLQNAL
ncbi:8-oxo-dGTP diphosphatase MutT [Alteromonas aestuariivivens]|uniref:8-oxo-dGTP diphosphatase n=1 Tax=Alteromonas aestuariivivens TaxID=1938339 RepID=A0A3D8MEN3_9ALTE|nr:8-oxo-dGTP diphosphatase MutT [Alteromonas aestuariivivens]RDV29076.1 8-oxo-dGTP diphosphatase MutT [Alteromonas aestuariivivens]